VVSENDAKDTNQHYITKAHLDKFVHPESMQPVLYPYRKGGAPCRPTGTKRLGSAINFYRQIANGSLTDALDEARKKSETLLFSSGKRTPSSISKCVFDDGYLPAKEDAAHLAAAAAFLFCGSPVQIHNTAMHLLLLHQIDLFNRIGTKEAEELYREQYGEAASERLAEDRRRILDGKLFADVGRENWKQLGFESFHLEEHLIELLLGMRMTVATCHRRSFFVTSDNPVVRTYPSRPDQLNDEMWFPISYKRGVLWHRRSLSEKTTFGFSETISMNRRMIKHAHIRIYSPRPEDWIREASKEATFDPLLGHYGSLSKVIAASEEAIDMQGKPREIVDLVAAMRAGQKIDVLGLDRSA